METASSVSKDVDSYIKALKDLFFKDQVDQYVTLLKTTEQSIISGDISYSSLNLSITEADSILSYFKSDQIVQQIYSDIQLLDRSRALYDMMTFQEPKASYSGVDTWFKYEDDVKTVTLCGKTTVKGTFKHILAVLSEIDLLQKCSSSYEDIIRLPGTSPLRWLIQIKMPMPFGISNRDMILDSFGILESDNKSAFLVFKSVDTFLDVEIPREESNYKRIFCHFGFYYIKYISPELYEFSFGLNCDPKIPILPWAIINILMRNSIYYMINDIKMQIEDPTKYELYDTRIKEKPEIYGCLDEK